MSYIDGFVLIVPKKNVKAYCKMAKQAGKLWREHGALEYFECMSDDVKVKMGLPFPRLTSAKPSEVIFFSWILFKSKAHRNKVNAKVLKDKRIENMCDPNNMPFEMKRMSYGGFSVKVRS